MELAQAERPDEQREPLAQRVVLVVEDNQLNFELVNAVLERAGFTVRWARDGIEAVHALASDDLDLLILDLHLPRLSGLDVLRRTRSAPATRDLPVLVLTADAMAGTREAVMSEGATDYLTKPFDLATLRAAVARILE
jgi:CheY-like chemotaxis protein